MTFGAQRVRRLVGRVALGDRQLMTCGTGTRTNHRIIHYELQIIHHHRPCNKLSRGVPMQVAMLRIHMILAQIELSAG